MPDESIPTGGSPMVRDVMLHEFIHLNRDVIISGTRDRVRSRPWPSVAPGEVEDGVPLFLTQLSETLRLEATSAPFSTNAIGAAAARHGRDLLRSGFTVSQVVHDYGDICQTITALAVEQGAPISVEEFHTLNRCLDTAIAEAVTEHARLTAETRSAAAPMAPVGKGTGVASKRSVSDSCVRNSGTPCSTSPGATDGHGRLRTRSLVREMITSRLRSTNSYNIRSPHQRRAAYELPSEAMR